ncbi:hypothetical protein NQ315_000176 [Exocentrus adspersus]|uniref:acid phosphatase n=1 Tax=Exocentrus adspersus TaxID=1586481 RepID=A0AAV8VQU1_9CUCU|nr:hypothetical protein NQ315_000176 [Exocentrus adspersus]
MKPVPAVFALVLIFQYSHGLKDDASDLLAVAVLYRHGDITPTQSFPTDPYFNIDYWPMGFGQLTEKGKLRQYRLGQWLRKRYSDFLPGLYNYSDIYVRSIDSDDALGSAEANLAGLYPPIKIEDAVLPQCVPIHASPTGEDQVLYMTRPCPKFDRLYEEVKQSEYFASINKNYSDFYEEVSNLTGWQIDDVDYFFSLQVALNVYANVAPEYLPSWYQDLDKDKVQYLAGLSYARYSFTPELKRLRVGPFFDYLHHQFNNTVMNEFSYDTSSKFLMMVSHSSTLSSVLNGLGLFDYKQPDFGSALIWEVRKGQDDEYYVSIFYRRNAEEEPELMEIPDCGTNCEYSKYMYKVESVKLDDWDIECQDQE